MKLAAGVLLLFAHAHAAHAQCSQTSSLSATVIAADAARPAQGIYSGSVQVDNAAGNYFEPADPRSFYAGLRWQR